MKRKIKLNKAVLKKILLTAVIAGLLVAGTWVSLSSDIEEEKLLKGNIFEKTQYLFSNASPSYTSGEVDIEGGVYLKGNTSPFLFSGETLAAAGVDSSEGKRERIVSYKVEKGDTLSSIAEKFNISVNTIVWANDVSQSSSLKEGEELIILPVTGLFHTVRRGETLSQIAETYKAKVSKIVKENGLENENDILAGDMLIVPGGEKPDIPNQTNRIPVARSYFRSYFMLPTQGRVTQGLHGIQGNAVDIANDCGKPVVAAAGGTVQRSGYVDLPYRYSGNRVTILHDNGVVSYYAHLSSVLVNPGQKVQAGDIIGRIGNTGYTLGPTGCHLHFTLRGTYNYLGNYAVGTYLSW